MSPIDLDKSFLIAAAYAAAVYCVMWCAARALRCLPSVDSAVTSAPSRYGVLDGCRGVLAVGVFVHHSHITFVYFVQQRWELGQSALLNHLGQTSVALFFMMTGFLFTLKVSTARVKWKDFYLARVSRLLPLYGLIVCAVFLGAFALKGWSLREPMSDIVRKFVLWMMFGLFGSPDVNGVPDTSVLIAGVNWSLRYECAFYMLAVPLLHLALRFSTKRLFLILSAGALATLLILRSSGHLTSSNSLYLAHFLSGITIAAAIRDSTVGPLIRRESISWFGLLACIALLTQINAKSTVAVFAALVVFATCVVGPRATRPLRDRTALWLGDVSYGIYLIHGLVLWTSLAMLNSLGWLQSMTFWPWFAVVTVAAVLVVSLSSASYLYLELPIMRWMQRRTSRPTVAAPLAPT